MPQPISLYANHVTLKDAADRLGVSKGAVYQYVRRHKIPTRKVGDLLFVRLAFLSEMRVPAAEKVNQ